MARNETMQSPLNLLLVEDDQDTRVNLTDILEIDGHRVSCAESGAAARQKACAEKFDIVLLDRKLPDTTAEDLLPELLQLSPDARVVVMTGFANLNSTISAFRSGAADYIIKPVNIDALRNSLKNIQQSKEVEKQLREKREFSDLILDTADAIILVLNLEGRIVRVNDYFLRITDWTEEEVTGEDWFELCVPEHDRERVQNVFNQTARDSGSRGIVNPVLTKFGQQRQIRWSNNVLRDGQNEISAILAVGIDVTDHIAIEQQLLQAERLAGMGQTMAAIAHESRNALQRINAGVEMLEEITKGNGEAKPDLMVIKRAAHDLHSVFEEVRSFAAPINLHIGNCDLAQTVQNAWNNVVDSGSDCDATFLCDFHHGDLLVHADCFRIEQVFRNLFENSFAACRTSPKITVQATLVEDDCQIVVSDNGTGLSDLQRSRIFEPFFTTKAKGTGLGMAIVKRIISAHHGQIAVLPNTANATGARFQILLPIHPSRNKQPA